MPDGICRCWGRRGAVDRTTELSVRQVRGHGDSRPGGWCGCGGLVTNGPCSRECLVVAFQELLLLSALQLLLGPGGRGLGAVTHLITRADQDTCPSSAALGQACAMYFTPTRVPRRSQEAAVVSLLSQRRLGEGGKPVPGWEGLEPVPFHPKSPAPKKPSLAQLGCLSYQEVGGELLAALLPGYREVTGVRGCPAQLGRGQAHTRLCPAPSPARPPPLQSSAGERKRCSPHGTKLPQTSLPDPQSLEAALLPPGACLHCCLPSEPVAPPIR